MGGRELGYSRTAQPTRGAGSRLLSVSAQPKVLGTESHVYTPQFVPHFASHLLRAGRIRPDAGVLQTHLAVVRCAGRWARRAIRAGDPRCLPRRPTVDF